MQNEPVNNRLSFAIGAVVGLYKSLLTFALSENFGQKMLEAGITAIVCGFLGMLGKQIFTWLATWFKNLRCKYFPVIAILVLVTACNTVKKSHIQNKSQNDSTGSYTKKDVAVQKADSSGSLFTKRSQSSGFQVNFLPGKDSTKGIALIRVTDSGIKVIANQPIKSITGSTTTNKLKQQTSNKKTTDSTAKETTTAAKVTKKEEVKQRDKKSIRVSPLLVAATIAAIASLIILFILKRKKR